MLVQMKDQYTYQRMANARAELDSAEVNKENVQMNGSRDDRIGLQAELLKMRMDQSAAASALATLRELAARGSASESEVEAATQRLQTANTALNALMERATGRYSEADIHSWKARVQADKAAVAAEKVSYENAHISTPIDGTVYDVPIASYDFVPVGADLVRVADLSKLRIHANFFELDVHKLRVGELARIAWEGNPNRSWRGRVVETPLAVSSQGTARVGRTTIEINDENGDVPINTNVTVIVTADDHSHALTIPREALYADRSNAYVYRLVDGSLAKTPVGVGIVNAMRAEIVKGIASSDVVVLHAKAGEALVDGLRVTRAR